MDPMELGAPLHRIGPEVPEPTPDTGERLCLLEPGVHFCERGLRKVLFGDVVSHDDLPKDLALMIDQGGEGEGDRNGESVGPDDLRLEMPDAFAGSHPGDDLIDLVAKVRGKYGTDGTALNLVGRSAEEPFGVLAEVGDLGRMVARHDGIVGQLDDRTEKHSR